VPRGVPKNGKRTTRRRKDAGVKVFGEETRLVVAVSKTLGRPKIVDLGDRWGILTTR
jgi:hypothetical protein